MRLPDWPRRLNEYVVANRANTYKPGVHDCVTFAAGAVKAITGQDHAQEYSTIEAGRDLLRAMGHSDLEGYLRTHFGDPVPGVKGQRGDIAYDDGVCGVILGRVAIFVVEHAPGFDLRPISTIRKAFRVR